MPNRTPNPNRNRNPNPNPNPNTSPKQVDTADLWLSWWLRNTERMDGSSMLSGHVGVLP